MKASERVEQDKRKVVIAGGSGFIGESLGARLTEWGYEVVILSRSPQAYAGVGRAVDWDGKTLGAWKQEIDGAWAVVNLTGKNVNCRYTKANLKEINDSRVNSVKAVAAAIHQAENPPKVLVQASTLAIYGDAGDQECDETTAIGEGIPVETAKLWEQTFAEEPTPECRRVVLRISFVLGQQGGVLATLARLTRWFLGGTVGRGNQYISWIHIDDLCEMFRWAIEREDVSGLYNATNQSPVTNRQFMKILRRVLGRPWSPPAPAWAVRMGAFFMRTESVLALTGRKGIPTRFVEQGFRFRYTELEETLRVCLERASS